MSGDTLVVPYRPSWESEGRDRIARVREALGRQALQVDHIGSTAVSGLCAKDAIDVQVQVAAPAAGRPLIDAMHQAGFVHMARIDADAPLDWPGGSAASDWRKLFFREPAGARRVHVHIRRAGAMNTRLALIFRDWLRADPQGCRDYAVMKTRLDILSDNNWVEYAARKEPLMAPFLLRARAWAKAVKPSPRRSKPLHRVRLPIWRRRWRRRRRQ